MDMTLLIWLNRSGTVNTPPYSVPRVQGGRGIAHSRSATSDAEGVILDGWQECSRIEWRERDEQVVHEAIIVRNDGGTLFAEIALPPMNLLGPNGP